MLVVGDTNWSGEGLKAEVPGVSDSCSLEHTCVVAQSLCDVL
jgi:hypothetical protein